MFVYRRVVISLNVFWWFVWCKEDVGSRGVFVTTLYLG